MTNFVLVYDRSHQDLLHKLDFIDRLEAVRARVQFEREYAGQESVEVVSLAARDEASLRSTHRRYFADSTELMTTLADSRF